MVQWPELWTRGAISLTRSSPSCSKNSRARTPTYFRDSRTRWAALSAERWMPASRRGAGADRENGEFAGERDKTLEDKGEERHLGLGFGDILRGAKYPLALAVVAHARSFKDRGKADGFYGGVEFAGIRDGGKFSGRDAEFAKERLLGEAVLRGCESGRRRIDGDAFGEKIGGLYGNVFKFVGDEFEAAGEFFECSLIAVVSRDALGDAAHGGFGRGVEKAEMQTERVARESEHVAELSAAEDADGHARLPFFFAGGGTAEGSGLARTRPVCSER